MGEIGVSCVNTSFRVCHGIVQLIFQLFRSIVFRYCPSVFILKPGQHLLINKGRLHAFRKLTFDELPVNDCHAQLRKNMISELKAQNIHQPPLCISVAFDW